MLKVIKKFASQHFLHQLSPLNTQILLEKNPQVYAFCLNALSSDDTKISEGSFQLNRFHEAYLQLSRKFFPKISPAEQIKVSRIELTKNKMALKFAQHIHNQAQLNNLPLALINGPNAPFHVLENGNLAMVMPEGFYLGESDLFQYMCYQRKDVFKWDVVTLLDQQKKLGYFSELDDSRNIKLHKGMLFDSEGHGRAVNYAIINSSFATYMFGEGYYISVNPDLLKNTNINSDVFYLVPTPPTPILKQSQEKKRHQNFSLWPYRDE
jgi:hypothetical protein